jgi:hypothetical protein
MKTQIDIHRTITNREIYDEPRFNSFRYELENGARHAQFVVALLALSAVMIALTVFFLKR